MPAIRSETSINKAAQRVRSTDPIQCHICMKVLNRKPDLKRHLLTHDDNAERFRCTFEGCNFNTLQKSNFETHVRTHTGDKIFHCNDDPDNCHFRAADPAGLTRHRKTQHGYVPRARKAAMIKAGKGTKASTAAPARVSRSAGASTSTTTTTTAPVATAAVPFDDTRLVASMVENAVAQGFGAEELARYSSSSSGYSTSSAPSPAASTDDFYPSPLSASSGLPSSRAPSVEPTPDSERSLSPPTTAVQLCLTEPMTYTNVDNLKDFSGFMNSTPSPAMGEYAPLPNNAFWMPLDIVDPLIWGTETDSASWSMLDEFKHLLAPAAPFDESAYGMYIEKDQQRMTSLPAATTSESVTSSIDEFTRFMEQLDSTFGSVESSTYF